jgi:hypothetical protein
VVPNIVLYEDKMASMNINEISNSMAKINHKVISNHGWTPNLQFDVIQQQRKDCNHYTYISTQKFRVPTKYQESKFNSSDRKPKEVSNNALLPV